MRRAIVIAAIAGGMASACTNSTQYVSSWKDPTARPFHLTHTLAVFMTTDPGMRRMVEDRLAARLPGGVPSYRLIQDAELKEMDSVKSHINAAGFNGAVVMRLVNEQTQLVATGNDFYGYWGYWNTAYNPIYYTTEQLYTVETVVYKLPEAKMVWMGRSQTVDPKNANKLADYSVNFAVKNMRKDGFLP